MNFKTMTSLVVLAALSCGEKASAILNGPLGDVINQDSRMVPSFKAPVDTTDPERQRTATARAVAMLDPTNKATVEKGLQTDIKAAFLIHYVHMLQEADFQGKVGGHKTPFKTAVLADRLQKIEAFDISTGDFAGFLKTLNTGHGAIDDSQVDALLGDLSNPLNITTQLVPALKQKRLAFLFYATQHGLDELPGVSSSPSTHTVTSSLIPPSFEEYLTKRKNYLQQVEESEELAEKTLQTSKLDEKAMLEEEERELREAEEALQKRRQEIAKKKQQAEEELARKKNEGLERAYKQAFETVELLDGSLEAMLNEVGGIWGNAFRAVTSIPDVVDQSNLAAEELMKHAQRVNQTEEASRFVNSEKRTALQKLTTNIKLFLDHQANFLQNPTVVSYKGRDQEELSIAARNFCLAQGEVKKLEESLTQLRLQLRQAKQAEEMVSNIQHQLEDLNSQISQAESQFSIENEKLLALESEKVKTEQQLLGLNKYLEGAYKDLHSLGMQLEQSSTEEDTHHSEENIKKDTPPSEVQERMRKLDTSIKITESSLASANQKMSEILKKLEKQESITRLQRERVQFLSSKADELHTNSDRVGTEAYKLGDLSEALKEEENRLELAKEAVSKAQEQLLFVNSQIKE